MTASAEIWTSASRYRRGHSVAAASPALSAAGFEPCSNSSTRTPATLRATSAVLSVQPLQTTISSMNPSTAALLNGSRVRLITAASLYAGIITEPRWRGPER